MNPMCFVIGSHASAAVQGSLARAPTAGVIAPLIEMPPVESIPPRKGRRNAPLSQFDANIMNPASMRGGGGGGQNGDPFLFGEVKGTVGKVLESQSTPMLRQDWQTGLKRANTKKKLARMKAAQPKNGGFAELDPYTKEPTVAEYSRMPGERVVGGAMQGGELQAERMMQGLAHPAPAPAVAEVGVALGSNFEEGNGWESSLRPEQRGPRVEREKNFNKPGLYDPRPEDDQKIRMLAQAEETQQQLNSMVHSLQTDAYNRHRKEKERVWAAEDMKAARMAQRKRDLERAMEQQKEEERKVGPFSLSL